MSESSNKQKRALVCGAGGFIGSHLVRRLKADGYWVRGVDLKRPQWSPSEADEFQILDLCAAGACDQATRDMAGAEVYQLAADMGGMGYIERGELDIVHYNVLINTHMLRAAHVAGVGRYFFSSSVCVYPDMQPGDPPRSDQPGAAHSAYPAMPDNEYGWEKLFSERLALNYARHTSMRIRIARFCNTYGPEGTWRGGREKAPAAICRKVAEAPGEGGEVEVWGSGDAIRSYTYIEDLLNGIRFLMNNDEPNIAYPCNIGSGEYVTVDRLVELASMAADKPVRVRHVPGPVGVASRNFTFDRIRATGWRPRWSLLDGLRETYPWIVDQVAATVERAAT